MKKYTKKKISSTGRSNERSVACCSLTGFPSSPMTRILASVYRVFVPAIGFQNNKVTDINKESN
jgi:hypothetical protein